MRSERDSDGDGLVDSIDTDDNDMTMASLISSTMTMTAMEFLISTKTTTETGSLILVFISFLQFCKNLNLHPSG